MLFIGRTMNKETQLGRKEKGRREEKKKQGNPQSCAYYLWNLTVITASIPCICVRLRAFSHWLCACFHIQSRRKRKSAPRSSDVLVQMLWVRPVWCSAAAQSWCHGAIQLQRNMSHLKLPFLPGGWISLLPNRISSSFLPMRSRNVL